MGFSTKLQSVIIQLFQILLLSRLYCLSTLDNCGYGHLHTTETETLSVETETETIYVYIYIYIYLYNMSLNLVRTIAIHSPLVVLNKIVVPKELP